MGQPVTNRDDVLAAVFEATVDELYRYASRLAGADAMFAEDLVQDAYIALRRQLDKGEAPESTIAWLKRVVRNRFLDLLRSQERERRRLMSIAVPESAPPSEGMSDGASVLDSLSADQRLALVLRYVDGCSVTEVASTLARTLRATESLLARARANVRAAMKEEGR